MGQIDREGTFRGHIIDKSFGMSKGGFPQFVARLQAAEMYDPETEQWLDWSKYDETEMVGYFILVGKDGNMTFNAEKLQKAVGWSGGSFSELEQADYSDMLVQFRVGYGKGEFADRLGVNSIDHADADPSNSLKKLDPAEIKALDAKFAAALKKFSGGPKPKTVPAGKPEPPKATKPAKPAAPKSKPPAAPKAEPEKPAEADAEAKAGGIAAHLGLPATCANADEAWAQVEQHVGKELPTAHIEEAWLKAVEDLGGEDAVEKEGIWANVRDIVLETMAEDPNF